MRRNCTTILPNTKSNVQKSGNIRKGEVTNTPGYWEHFLGVFMQKCIYGIGDFSNENCCYGGMTLIKESSAKKYFVRKQYKLLSFCYLWFGGYSLTFAASSSELLAFILAVVNIERKLIQIMPMLCVYWGFLFTFPNSQQTELTRKSSFGTKINTTSIFLRSNYEQKASNQNKILVFTFICNGS